MLVDDLMLQITPGEIGDDQPLFGPNSLGLDSVDALQIVVALEKHHGLKLANRDAARKVLTSVNTMAVAIEDSRKPVGQ